MKVIVTRHKALIQFLLEEEIITKEDAKNVITHATKEEVKGKEVIGVLPLALASVAKSITEVSLNLTVEQRGKELTIEDIRKAFNGIHTYVVREV